jgi:methionyl-tRNA formyltransferase
VSEEREIRIAFIGCVAEGRRSLETLLAMGEKVVGIFTLTPERAAKTSGAVRWDDLADEHGIPLHLVRNINDEEAVEALRELRPDLIFCVGWTQLLRKPILDLPRLGCIGFHASLLPRYRGRAPVNWAIINGETETGNTMMLLDDGVDTGDILAQRRFPIEPDDTCATVYEKVSRSEEEMIREVMPLVHQGRMPRRPQDHSRATVMPKRRPRDGVIDWNRSTRELHDWVRALTHPYPGAFTYLDGTRVRVWKASPYRPGPGGAAAAAPRPGWWRLEGEPPRLLAGTADGDLLLESVQRDEDEERDGVAFGRRWLGADGLTAEGGDR